MITNLKKLICFLPYFKILFVKILNQFNESISKLNSYNFAVFPREQPKGGQIEFWPQKIKFSFALISFKLGPAYISKDTRKTKKENFEIIVFEKKN